MLKHVLVMFDGDFEGEYDVHGFCVMTEEEWKRAKQEIKNAVYPYLWNCGGNDEMEFESAKEVMDDITVKEISDVDYVVLHGLFGSEYSSHIIFGHFPEIWAEDAFE